MGLITAIASQKGGVGKTTTAINLAAALALFGKRVLIVDADPQANATSGLGQMVPPKVGLADLIVDRKPHTEGVIGEVLPNLDLLPSGGRMRELERHLARFGAQGGQVIAGALQRFAADYDYVFIDCPPSLGALTTSALYAAGRVLVPVQCEYYAMEGLAQVIALLDHARKSGWGQATLLGVLLTMFDPRIQLAREVVDEVRRYFAEVTFRTVIPRDIALSEAPGHGATIIDYDNRSCGTWAYLQLAKEVLDRAG